MNNDPIDALYAAQAPKESAIRRYGKKIAGGIACSVFVAFLMHLPYIKAGIVWGCHIVVLLFGKPAGVESLEDKLAHVVAKGRQVAHDHPDAVKSLSPVKAVKEVIAVKKTVDDVKDKAQQSVQTIKDTGEKVADALGHVGERAKETVGGIGASVADLARGRAEAKEKAQREALEAHAAVIGFETDPDWTLPRLQAEVIKADRKWQADHGPNAKCTEPKCRYPLRFPRNATGNRRCPRCGNIFSVRTSLALGAPINPRSLHLFGR